MSALRTSIARVAWAACLSLAACHGASSSSSSSSEPLATVLDKARASGVLPTLDLTSSVGGADADGDGVRDDLQKIIAALPDTGAQRASLTQLARGMQTALTSDPTDASALSSAANQLTRAVTCVWSTYDAATAKSKVLLLEELSVNTLARFKAYEAFNAALNGTATTLPASGTTCDD